jgi:MSHA pilin protein MshC
MSDVNSQMKKILGFTLVELVMTMVIIGIMAAVAVPRFFSASIFQARGFADQIQATMRYAQKMAIAKNRFVCVAFASNSVTVTLDTTTPSASHASASCPGSNVSSPAGQTPYTISSSGGVTLSGATGFNFSAQGRASAAQSITVSGYATPITVEAETGYVH